jgi:hypothetical protein
MRAQRKRVTTEDVLREAFQSVLAELLAEYEQEVNDSEMTASSKYTYNNGAEQFVRWTRGAFHPGEWVR